MLVPTHKPNVYLNVRENCLTDLLVLREIWCEDVYRVNDKFHDVKTVLDLGANIGAFTCYILEYSPEAHVYAIEPEANNLELLKMNVKRVDPKRTTIIEKAVSDKPGKAKISNKQGGSRLVEDELQAQIVTVTTLDTLVTEHKIDDIDICKIDIEGCEVPVIMSMSMELQKRIKFFAIEFDDSSKGYGEMLEKLSETHKLTTMGSASKGGMIYGERYD